MSSVIGTAVARAPRNVRAKTSLGASLKKQEPSSGNKPLTGTEILSSISEVVALMERFPELITMKDQHAVKDLLTAIPFLCANLKAYGNKLETFFQDHLDRLFIHLRDASKDQRLDKISRLHLLEIIELRAGRWAIQDVISAYYKSKLAELSLQDAAQRQHQTTNVMQQPAYDTLYSDRMESIESPPMLLPGETVKFSGKYVAGQPSAQGSQQKGSASLASTAKSIKDEVVIRNSDSGKVMGIKGKRVHLIEEISDTVISFQRVNPGAKERLVQITGPGPKNIERARQLIEQTIQRNASPVRQQSTDSSTGDHPSGCRLSDDSVMTSTAKTTYQQQSARQSMIEPLLFDYQYTVVVGQHSVRVVGQNLELVQTAKMVLDDYFSATNETKPALHKSCSVDDGMGQSLPSSQLTSPRGSNPATANSKSPKYNRESLIMWSKSPLCRQPPANFHLLHQHAPEILRTV